MLLSVRISRRAELSSRHEPNVRLAEKETRAPYFRYGQFEIDVKPFPETAPPLAHVIEMAENHPLTIRVDVAQHVRQVAPH